MSVRPSIGGIARTPASASSAFGIERASAPYKSGGRNIRVESYLPEGEGRHPVVLVLHGAGGALHTKHEMESFAMHLASRTMGAFLAVAESTRDPRVRAVVEFAGGVFPGVAEHAGRFPPMLILHGREDRRVPVVCVRHLQDLACRFAAEPKVQIYEGEGHDLSKAASADATTRALDFFEANLSERRSH